MPPKMTPPKTPRTPANPPAPGRRPTVDGGFLPREACAVMDIIKILHPLTAEQQRRILRTVAIFFNIEAPR
jgi:hypothetical protein